MATLCLALALGVRTIVSISVQPSGWLASYYANDNWRGTPEWSSDFRWSHATRVDREIAFEQGLFPVHYLNGPRFTEGNQRDISQPMSVRWHGYLHMATPADVRLVLKARGRTTVTVDAAPALALDSSAESAEERLALAAGVHHITVEYVKPANSEGQVSLQLQSVAAETSPMTVVPSPNSEPAGTAWLVAGVVADSLAVAVLAAVAGLVMITRWRNPASRASLVVVTGLFGLLAGQGFLAARKFAETFVSLTAGDDWFGFESRARDILQHGPLMTLGQPLGAGEPYFFHPFYSYFLAATHGLIGESLFGPVFVQFLILAGVAFLMWRLTFDVFGPVAAAVACVALLAIFELDFARYYTVTLLSENLYILTVTLTLYSLAQWARLGAGGAPWAGGFWGGVSAITRPAMMVSLLPLAVVVMFLSGRGSRGRWRAIAAMALFGIAWMVPVSLATFRNWMVSSRFVLISDGLGAGVVKFNVPAAVDPGPYLASYSGSIVSGLVVLARVAWDHPIGFLSEQVTKFGFALGMIHWHEGYRPHPELIAITVLYLVMLIASPALRQPALWPVHVFVLAHVASMGLTSPWNYGYRLILPPFVFTTALSVAAAVALVIPMVRTSRHHQVEAGA